MTEPNLNNAAPETSKPQAESQPPQDKPETPQPQPPQNEPEEKKPESEPPQEKSEKEPEEKKLETESKEKKPESEPSQGKSENEPEEKKPEAELKEIKPESKPPQDKPETQSKLTPCPPSLSSPELQDEKRWIFYSNGLGRYIFHGGQKVYLENIKPTPERPQQECAFDGKTHQLITEKHPFSGVRGTPNEYDGHGSLTDAYHHTISDKGGIWEKGREAVADSMRLHGSNLQDYLESKLEKLGLSEEKSGSSLTSQMETSRELERQRERE